MKLLLKVGEVGREDVSWKFLAQDRVQWQDMMHSVSVISGSSVRCQLSTVIPRLTKIIRSGITFISRNLH